MSWALHGCFCTPQSSAHSPNCMPFMPHVRVQVVGRAELAAGVPRGAAAEQRLRLRHVHHQIHREGGRGQVCVVTYWAGCRSAGAGRCVSGGVSALAWLCPISC